MRRQDDDERRDRPVADGTDAERPDQGEPWAKTSSGDADSITEDDDTDE